MFFAGPVEISKDIGTIKTKKKIQNRKFGVAEKRGDRILKHSTWTPWGKNNFIGSGAKQSTTAKSGKKKPMISYGQYYDFSRLGGFKQTQKTHPKQSAESVVQVTQKTNGSYKHTVLTKHTLVKNMSCNKFKFVTVNLYNLDN